MPEPGAGSEVPPVPIGRGQQVIPRPPVWSLGPAPLWAVDAAPTLAQVLNAVPQVTRPLLPAFRDSRHSAVLVVLTDVGAGPEVLLTRRSWEMRTHRGEVSFPGGRMDPGESALDTALREAREEVGLEAEGGKRHEDAFSLVIPASLRKRGVAGWPPSATAPLWSARDLQYLTGRA